MMDIKPMKYSLLFKKLSHHIKGAPLRLGKKKEPNHSLGPPGLQGPGVCTKVK